MRHLVFRYVVIIWETTEIKCLDFDKICIFFKLQGAYKILARSDLVVLLRASRPVVNHSAFLFGKKWFKSRFGH